MPHSAVATPHGSDGQTSACCTASPVRLCATSPNGGSILDHKKSLTCAKLQKVPQHVYSALEKLQFQDPHDYQPPQMVKEGLIQNSSKRALIAQADNQVAIYLAWLPT